MRIVHVTEALAGGVAHCLSQLAQAQASDGHEVLIVHSVRHDTPLGALKELFPPPIGLKTVPMVTSISPVADARALFLIAKLLKAERPDIIHLHSSKAGVLGRAAAKLVGMGDRVFYSPHGFAFLRSDVSIIKKLIFLNLERVANKLCGTVIGCSATETELARARLGNKCAPLVENSVDLNALPIAVGSAGPVRILTSGRICYQKAPWRFRKVAERCADLSADFIWLGDGDLREHLMSNGVLSTNLEIVGWKPRKDVYSWLAGADMFVLASLWEGMPLALIEAQAVGLPAVVSDVVGNRDVVIHGKTGFVCRTDAEFLQKTRLLIEDADLRRRMGRAAREMAVARFSVGRMHREMMAVYNQQGMAQDAG